MKTSLVLILLLIVATGTGQGNNSGLGPLEKGDIFNTPRNSNFSGFLGQNAQTLFSVDYIAINRKKQELNLRRFHSGDLSLVDSRDLFRVIDDNYYNEPNEIFYQENQIFLFSTLNALKGNHKLIYIEIFNEYGELINEKVIDTLEADEKYLVTEPIEKDGFLIATHNQFENIFEQSIGLKSIHRNGAIRWENTVKSPVSLQNMTLEQVHYSLDAPVYLLCDYGFDKGSTRQDNTDLLNHKYAIWGYDPHKKLLKEFDIRIKNRWINGISIQFNSKHDLVVNGFMNETRRASINGVFTLHLSSEMTVINSTYYKYKRAFYQKFAETKKAEKLKELDDIVLRNCVLLGDDSYFLIGEHFYHFTERNYDPRTNITTTTENYNYNSIVVAYFDPNGHHLWTEKIPKYQQSINDYGYYSSFAVMKHDMSMYLFFNDSDRNNELALTDYFGYRSLYNNRRFQITYVRVNPDGVQARGSFIDNNNNFTLRPRQSYQIDDNRFFLYGENGKNRRVFATRPQE
ncbi:MAG: hypothetical protein ACPG21_09850 [Crocinitomicaceae bacterium]